MEQKSRVPKLRNRVCTDPVPLNISHHEDITWYTKIRKYYLVDADVESWGDDTTLVQTTVQFNDNLASSVVIDDFEFTNVSVFHHNLKKLDDDLKTVLYVKNDQMSKYMITSALCVLFWNFIYLGGWSDQDLSLATLFSIANIFQSISQNIHANHGD